MIIVLVVIIIIIIIIIFTTIMIIVEKLFLDYRVMPRHRSVASVRMSPWTCWW